MAITKIQLNGVEYDIGIDTQLYNGRELSDYTWAQLKAKCQNADFKGLRIGDYKTINVEGRNIQMQIAGIDTYYNIIDKHHIDWISVNCSGIKRQWSNKDNNNGGIIHTGAHSSAAYLASSIAMYLETNYYDLLPSDVQAVIHKKVEYLEERSDSEYTLTDSTSNNNSYFKNRIWLPNEYEIFGSIILGTPKFSGGNLVQYPLFANSTKNRIKAISNESLDSKTNWWLSTVTSGSNSEALYINTDGIVRSQSIKTEMYFPVCFSIA